MQAKAIKTRALIPPEDNLLEVIVDALKTLENDTILVISSKVVAIWQGRCVGIPEDAEEHRSLKESLMRSEADLYLEKDESYPYSRIFTINDGIFGSSSGIDESNGNGYFVLLPKDANGAAKEIRAHLMQVYGIARLGIVIVDSRTQVMRNGVVGISLGHAGFRALYDYRNTEDIFGRMLKYERLNVADCLASTGTLMMGEGDECTPLVVCTDVPKVIFGEEHIQDEMLTPQVKMEDDVFSQFISREAWKQNKRHGNS